MQHKAYMNVLQHIAIKFRVSSHEKYQAMLLQILDQPSLPTRDVS